MRFALEMSTRGAAAMETARVVSPALTGAVIKSPVAMPQHANLLRRVQEMQAKSAFPKVKRAYDAAVTTNLNADFLAATSSANAEILTSLPMARNRSRKLCRDNQYAKGIIRTDKNNVVGEDPFRLEMKVGKKDAKGKFIEETDTNALIEDAWKDAGLPENCTVRRDMSRLEMYHLVEAAAFRDGSVLARHWTGFPHNKFGYAIQLLEADRLQESYLGRTAATADAPEGNVIRFSIERDRWDAPVAYWILTRHPGDVFGYNGMSQPVYRERVEAKDVIHFNNMRDRAEQDIGMTELDTIIQTLHRIEQFDIAHVTAAIWASCKPFFILQKLPSSLEYIGDTLKGVIDDAAADETGETVSAVEPATGEKLPYGQEPFLVDPKFPIESGPAFKKEQLRGVASGAGIAYHTLANDLEGVNFSSGRLGENAQRDNWKVRQNHMIFGFVRLHFSQWLKYAMLSGQVALPMSRYEEFVKAATWHAKRWPYVNPTDDSKSDILRIDKGLTSRSKVIAESERGGDVETVDAEIASDRAIDEAHDLDFRPIDQQQLELAAEAGDEGGQEPAGAGSNSGKLPTNGARRNGSLNGKHL